MCHSRQRAPERPCPGFERRSGSNTSRSAHIVASESAREDQIHVRQLVEPDAVLAGDRAAGVDARRHDLAHRDVHARRLVGVGRVVGDVRVQVAVAGVEHVADLHAMSLRRCVDLGEHLGQLRARHDRVLHDEVRRRRVPSRRTPSCAPARAARARPRRARRAPCARRCSLQSASTVATSRSRPAERAVELDEQHRRGVGRIAGRVDRRLRRRGSSPGRSSRARPERCPSRRSPTPRAPPRRAT